MAAVEGSGYFEAIVECDPPQVERVQAWLDERGLGAHRMRSGVLATGSAERMAAAFGGDVGERDRPRSLPIPPELAGVVRSVTVVPVPRYQT
jgi:hypothetical protein